MKRYIEAQIEIVLQSNLAFFGANAVRGKLFFPIRKRQGQEFPNHVEGGFCYLLSRTEAENELRFFIFYFLSAQLIASAFWFQPAKSILEY